MANRSSEVVVIGGGIAGSAVAYYLAKAGVEVTLVERRGIAREASGANVGLVVACTKVPGTFFWDLIRDSIQIYPGLDEELGYETEYQRIGSVTMYLTPESMEKGRQLVEQQHAAGMDIRMISAEEAQTLEPALRSVSLVGGSYCPTDGVVNPLSITLAFAWAAARCGARIVCPAEVTGIEVKNGAVAAVETDRGKILTRTVVNAAGAWAAQVGRFVGVDVPVIPCRGQMMITERMAPVVKRVIMGIEPFTRQTMSGTILIGSVPEFVGYDKHTNIEAAEEYASTVCKFFPFLQDALIVRTWAGLRPATEDGLPFIGRVDGVEGFILATGYYRNGMGVGPAIGSLLADLILGKPTRISFEPCSLSRLLARA